MAGSSLKGINIKIGAETSGLDRALSDVNKRARDSQKELKQVEKLLKLDPKNTELVAQKQKLLADAVKATRDKLTALKDAQKQVEAQFKSGDIGEEQYREFQREVVKTEQELGRLEEAAKKAGRGMAKSLDEAGKKMQVAGDKMRAVGDKTKGAGESVTRNVTAPLLAAAAAGIALGAEIDDAFDNIRIKTGATGPLLEGLQDDFRAVAGSIPASFGDVSTAITDLNRRLDLTGKPLQDVARQFLELSRLTGTDLTGNIEAGAAAFSAFDVPAKNYAKSLDLVFKTSQSTGIGIGDLFSEIQGAAPILKTFGFGFEESAALVGTLKKAGVETGPVLAGLKKALATMAKGGVKDADKALGLLFAKIKNAPNDMTATKVAIETFGAKAGPALAKNIREGKVSYEDLLKSIKGSKESIGTAAAETDDWKEKLLLLWNQVKLKLEPSLTRLFNSVSKAIPAIKAIADKVVGLVDAFTKLSPHTQKMILIFLGIAAAIGPVLVILGTLISSIGAIAGGVGAVLPILGSLGGAFVGLLGFLGPVGIALVAITAVLVVFGIEAKKTEDAANRAGTGLDNLAGATGRSEVAAERLSTAQDGVATALDKSRDAAGKYADAQRELVSSGLRVERAQAARTEAQERYNAAVKAGGKGSKDAKAADIDLRQANLDLATAIGDKAEAVKASKDLMRLSITTSQELREAQRAEAKATNDAARADADLVVKAKESTNALLANKRNYLDLIPAVGGFKKVVTDYKTAQHNANEAIIKFGIGSPQARKAADILAAAQGRLRDRADEAEAKVSGVTGAIRKLPKGKTVTVSAKTPGLANLQALSATMASIGQRLGIKWTATAKTTVQVKSFAEGGVVTHPMLAMVGDRKDGKPEYIGSEQQMRDRFGGSGETNINFLAPVRTYSETVRAISDIKRGLVF